MVSATGPTSAIGIPQRNTGEILPRTIGGEHVRYYSLDDGGDTTRAVQNVKKLIQEDHVDAVIGPSTTPNALAILDVIAEATLREQGYTGPIYQTHAVATQDFIRLGKDKVEGTILAAGPMLVIDEIPDSNPTKKVALDYIAKYRKAFGVAPATFGANVWDAGILLERAIPTALKHAKPGTQAFRAALRNALESEREVIGCQGVFNMSATNHNGMDERARVLVTIQGGHFRLLPE